MNNESPSLAPEARIPGSGANVGSASPYSVYLKCKRKLPYEWRKPYTPTAALGKWSLPPMTDNTPPPPVFDDEEPSREWKQWAGQIDKILPKQKPGNKTLAHNDDHAAVSRMLKRAIRDNKPIQTEGLTDRFQQLLGVIKATP